jgi:deazaflavin-dependent oxidoreductase (nitroreductase family)
MPEANDCNEKIVAEFRANGGRVGGNFEGAPVVLVHHRGRKSRREYTNPMMYLPDDADNDTIYVFTSKAGATSNPDWYYNLTAVRLWHRRRRHGDVPRDRPRAPGRRTRSHLRRAGTAVAGLRRLRAARCRHANDPGARVEALLRALRRRVALGPQ